MKTNDIVKILNEHRDITQVILESAKDCKDFWTMLCSDVYGSIPSTIENGDNPIIDTTLQATLQDFAEVDSLEVVNKKGRILKRFANYWKEQKGFKLPDNVMGIIGDTLQRHLNQQSRTFYYDFTDVIDWNDGQFGKESSCWWGCYSESKEVYTENGGWGIRFYENTEDTDGIGRTWILPKNGMLLGFNSYGVSRPQTSKVIKAIFADHGIKLHYKQVSIENSQNSNVPYINGDSGFVLYPDDISGDSVPDSFDIDMETSNSREHCTDCNCSLDTEYGEYEYINDNYYCSNCAHDRFSSCEYCGEWYDKDDVHETNDDRWLCEYCAKQKGYVECYECNKWTDEYKNDADGDSFCESCADTHLTYCEHCEEHFYQDSHAGNCPATLDYSGLVETTEEIHAKLRTPSYTADYHSGTFTVYRIDGCKGLALYNPHHINHDLPNGWNISHDVSGLAIKSGLSFNTAKRILIAIAGLTDWTASADTISNNRELMKLVNSIIRDIIS